MLQRFRKMSPVVSEYIAEITREVFEEITSFIFHTLTSNSLQDYAVLSVAAELDL